MSDEELRAALERRARHATPGDADTVLGAARDEIASAEHGRPRKGWLAIAAGLALLGGIGGYVALGGDDEATTTVSVEGGDRPVPATGTASDLGDEFFGLEDDLTASVTDLSDDRSSPSVGYAPSGAIGGYEDLVCGIVDFDAPRDPLSLADGSDLVAVGAVAAVHEGRTFDYPESPGTYFATVLLELDQSVGLDGTSVEGPVYVEVEVCGVVERNQTGTYIGPLGAAEVAGMIPAGSTAVWFLTDLTDWEPDPSQPLTWIDDDPVPGESSIFAPEVVGIIYENPVGTVSMWNVPTPGWLGAGWSLLEDLPAEELVATLAEAIGPADEPSEVVDCGSEPGGGGPESPADYEVLLPDGGCS